MVASLQAMRDVGYLSTTLWVLADNARGRGFYEAGGWRPDGRSKKFGDAGIVELRYGLELSS